MAEAPMLTAELKKDGPRGLDHIMKISQPIPMKCFEHKSPVQVIMVQFSFSAVKSACRLIFFNYKITIFSLKWFVLLSAIGVNNGL